MSHYFRIHDDNDAFVSEKNSPGPSKLATNIFPTSPPLSLSLSPVASSLSLFTFFLILTSAGELSQLVWIS